MIEVQIKDIDELIKSFGKLNVQGALNKAIKKSIFTLERTAKINTPVDTWLLRNSYETNFGNLEWTLRNYREYGVYVEAKQKFLYKSIGQELENIENIFNWEIDALIQTI